MLIDLKNDRKINKVKKEAEDMLRWNLELC